MTQSGFSPRATRSMLSNQFGDPAILKEDGSLLDQLPWIIPPYELPF
jgi:hypothetical protein